MWVTFFSLAMAASVWFSAANLAVQLSKDRAAFNATIERRELAQPPNERLSSAAITSRTSPDSRFN